MKFPSWRTAVLSAYLAVGANPLWAVVQVPAERLKAMEQQAVRTADEILELALGYDERDEQQKAKPLYEEAAARGVAVAELRLGWFYESGLGGEQSYEEAHRRYARAVAAGVAEANLRLGLLYLEGWGVKRNVAKMMEHMNRAAEAGYQPAQEIFSLMYFSGVGVKADIKEAARWAEQAAQPDNPEAQVLAGNIARKAARLPSDIQAARNWYQLSAEAECATGMREMAATFFRPGASEEDLRLGIRWLELAVEHGDGLAGFYLAGVYLLDPKIRLAADSMERARELLKKSESLGISESGEVLELEKEGKPLAEGFRYVKDVPYENRYIKQMADSAADLEADPKSDVNPRPIKMVRPVYPAALKLAKLEGSVVVQFIVDYTGRVLMPEAISSTHPGFTSKAIAAISSWRFRPGYRAGRPVNVMVQISIEFLMGEYPGDLSMKLSDGKLGAVEQKGLSP